MFRVGRFPSEASPLARACHHLMLRFAKYRSAPFSPRGLGYAKLAHVRKAPKPRLLAPFARRDEERAVSVEEPQGPDSLAALEAG